MVNVNTDQTGIRAIFKDHEIVALKILEEAGIVFIGVREIWIDSNERLKEKGLKTRSRPTYYYFIKGLADLDLLETREVTGKGGRYDEYRLKPGGMIKLKTEVSKRIIETVVNAFPELDFGEVITGLEQVSLFD